MPASLFMSPPANYSQIPFVAMEEEEAEKPMTVLMLLTGIGWLCVIALMFFAQHHVCDAYFVPAINVFIEKTRKSKNSWITRWGEEAVAGATICALGCNGPELASNLISLYTCSDAGIGVVVGSEIFNLLIICGCATLASPKSPLPLEKVPFTRDCIFYFISIILLAVFLKDETVEFWEASILLGFAVIFVGTVYFTSDIVNGCPALRPDAAGAAVPMGSKPTTAVHGVQVDVTVVTHSRMNDGGIDDTSMHLDARNRGMLLQGDEMEMKQKPNARGSYGFNLGGGDALLGASSTIYYKDLMEIAVGAEGVLRLEFTTITLIVTCHSSEDRQKLLEEIKKHDEKIWVHDYDCTVVSAFSHLHHAWCGEKDRNIAAKLLAIPEFLIDVLLKLTLFAVDVKDVRKENRWVGCFAGAMFWLATFSFLMLEVADQVNQNIPALKTAFLGITVCAIGTSLPNAFASVIMAQQGKPGAAIANALGSNVQNVFLAMAFPWVINMLIPYKQCSTAGPMSEKEDAIFMAPIVMGAKGLQEGVIWMLLTLAVVIFFVLLPEVCSLSKVYGYILCAIYILYLADTSMEVFDVLPSDKIFGLIPKN